MSSINVYPGRTPCILYVRWFNRLLINVFLRFFSFIYIYSKVHQWPQCVWNRRVGFWSAATKIRHASCTIFEVRGVCSVSNHTRPTCVRCGFRPVPIICWPADMTTSWCLPICKVTEVTYNLACKLEPYILFFLS